MLLILPARLGEVRLVGNVAARSNTAAANAFRIGRGQSSPRSRSSRRIGSGIAATLAAADLPRSGGAASWFK